MVLSAEQFEENEQLSEQTMAGESADSIRSQIAAFLRDKEFRKTLDPEAIRNYEDIVNKKGHIKPDDVANLRKFYEFMKEQYEEIQGGKKRIEKHINQAIRERIITDKDRKFYEEKMGENIITGNQNVTAEMIKQAEKDVLDSLENRRDERKKYDDLANSPLVENGFLIVGETKKIPIPDENKFLRMSVPERRKWLKSVEEVMPEVEKFGKNREKAKALKLTKEYETLLRGAKKEKIIGDKTIQKFMEWFKGQNNEVKQFAIGEFFKEMSRYRDLWKDIRKTLKGKGLSRLEGLRGNLGYTELRIEFMNEEYAQKLDEKLNKKIINEHIKNAFAKDFESKSIEEKEHYLNEFDQQIKRYETLRADIEGLEDEKARNKLLEMYSGENGWTEISAAYNEVANQSESSYADVVKSKRNQKELNVITSTSKRRAIIEGAEELDHNERKELVKRLKHHNEYRQLSKLDAGNYQKDLKEARQEQEAALAKKAAQQERKEEGTKVIPMNTFQDKIRKARQKREVETDTEEEKGKIVPIRSHRLRGIEKDDRKTDQPIASEKTNPELISGKRIEEKVVVHTKTNANETFEQQTFVNPGKENKRVAMVYIDTKEAVQSFISQPMLNRERDKLRAVIWNESTGKGEELTGQETDAAIKYIEEEERNENLERMKKAA